MVDPNEKIEKIAQFIEDYLKRSKQRGKMYGSIGELESNWDLLDKIYLILNDMEEEQDNYNFSAFLLSKGFGVKSVATMIHEMRTADPYAELNKLRNEYEKWRKMMIVGKKKS